MNDIALPTLSRPAFFTGQRLLPGTLDDTFAVPMALHQLHNRVLHGNGIGFGLDVDGERAASIVTVGAGYAIDAAGRDLVVAEPVALGVPPVSSAPDGSPVSFTIVVSATSDEDARVEVLGGVCATVGAVRRDDAPTVRFVLPELVRDGLDVIIGQVRVLNCRLVDRWSPSGRRSVRPGSRPHVAGGATVAGGTGWHPWPNAANPSGVAARVSTAEAGFGDTPRYAARVEGDRLAGGVLVDGPATVDSPTPTSFVLVVTLPQGFAVAGGTPLNPPGVFADGFLDARGWRVVWIGVEG